MSYVTDTDLAATGPSQGAAMVGFAQALDGAVSRTVSDKAREIKSFEDWGARPDDPLQSKSDLLAAITAAWESALENGHDLYHPGGVYDIGAAHFPWRAAGAAQLLDCKNITIWGNGPRSVFKTSSGEFGWDVFQLHSLKNIHFRNLAITAELTAEGDVDGANAISVTGGYDNVTLLDIWCYDLPSRVRFVDTGDEHLDGGAALSVQSEGSGREMGSLTARVFAKGCAIGFGFSADPVPLLAKKPAVKVDLVAEDCWQAIQYNGAPPTVPAVPATNPPTRVSVQLPAGVHVGIMVRAQAINCQTDVALGRAYGVAVDCQVITTKTADARRRDPNGRIWWGARQAVQALWCTYAKNSQLRVTGNKGECDYKAQIGGADDNGSGTPTEQCDIFLDLGGTQIGATGAPVAPEQAIREVVVGGASVTACTLSVTPATGAVPPGFLDAARGNFVLQGGRLSGIKLMGADPMATLAEVKAQDGGVAVRQIASSVPGQPVLVVLNDANVRVAALRNDGAMMTEAIVPADVGEEVAGAVPFYDNSNTLVGYALLHKAATR